MSEMSSSAPEKSGSAKKPVSPARNVIGLIVLVAVVVVGGFEVWAKTGYNSAVNKLDRRSQDENKELMTISEAEVLLDKQPDGAGSDAQEGTATYTKNTYTWKGLINSYTLTTYYTKEKEPKLHHYEANEKFTPEPKATQPPPGTTAPPPGEMVPSDPSKRKVAKQSEKGKSDDAKAKADEKKPADAKAKADEKKPADDDKAKTPEKGN